MRGCQLQHLSETAYKIWKRELVTEAVARAGGDPALVGDLVSVPISSRRRAVFTAIRDGKRFRLGFRHRQGHSVEKHHRVFDSTPRLAELLPPLRASLETETNLRHPNSYCHNDRNRH